MKKKIMMMKQKLKYVSIVFSIVLMQALPVLADDKKTKGDPKIVSGTKSLIADGLKILIALTAATTAFIAGFHGFKWYFSDETKKPACVNNIKMTILIGVIIISIEGIVTWVFSYYTS